ncbi:MAG: tRNA-intron lyase [Candidatus Kariarchaeaceae archaeon]|jgi:tRNA-intron endonuclease
MVEIPNGEIDGDCVRLTGSNAISVYNKGYYGVTDQDGVILSGFEALHLLELDRITVTSSSGNLTEQQLTHHFTSIIDDFMGRYLVYKDLRNRGYIVNQGSGSSFFFRLYLRGKVPKKDSATYYVTPLREGSSINLVELDDLVKLATASQKTLVVGLVDASGDVSYLQINQLYPPDIQDSHSFFTVGNWDWETVRTTFESWND